MEEMTRMSLHVPADIPDKLVALSGGVKKMGAYLTLLIRQAHEGQVSVGDPGDLELLTAGFKHLSAKVKELDGRVQQVEER